MYIFMIKGERACVQQNKTFSEGRHGKGVRVDGDEADPYMPILVTYSRQHEREGTRRKLTETKNQKPKC